MTARAPNKIRVAVLRGGPSHNYENSLRTGAHITSLLRDMDSVYEPLDIFISRDGEWHYNGVKHKPEDALWHSHIVWNALHGHYGEDGQVQKILESLEVPYVGSQREASFLSINKELAKNIFAQSGLRTPQHELITRETLDEARLVDIFRNYLHPVVVKPSNGSGWLGVRPVYTFADLKTAIYDAFNYSPKVLVEEFVRGKTASCVIVEGARGEKLHALMPVEIGKEQDTCPGSFSTGENKLIEEAAKLAHTSLGMRHYSVSDFVITKRGNVYILETNSSPEIHEDSHVPKAFSATGWRPHDFLDHIIKLTLDSR
jgi:D-alanine-D-alanine ligase